MFSSLFVIGGLVASAAAHGFVSEITINGKSFKGNTPGGANKDSVIRLVSANSPVKGADNPDINCGLDAQKAALMADAMPGDSIEISWPAGGGQNWPHNTGPMLTYLASCGDQDCSEFDSTKAKWFKIQQVGLKADGKTWEQADLMNGEPAKLTLPSNLAAGNYLMRHEIIALHLANSEGGAEFYPSCSQLKVGGTQTGAPSSNELVSLPGAYSDNDPGIFVPNVFNGNLDYEFPGPKIASFVDGSSNSNSGSDDGASSSSASSSTKSSKPTSTRTSSSVAIAPTGATSNSSSSSTGTKSCTLKKRDLTSASLAKRKVKEYKPRHISRIMRNIVARDGFSTSH